MKNKYILGGGLSGLIYAFYNPEYKIIAKNIGGKLNNQSMKNIVLLHATPETEQFLTDLGLEIKKKTHIIKYVKNNTCTPEVYIIDKINFIKKKMDDDNFIIDDTNLSTDDYYISILDVDFTEIINKILEKVIIIEDNIIRITDSQIITEKTRFEYDEVISTIPAPFFWKLYYKTPNINLISKPVTFVLTDSLPKILETETFNLAYFIDKKFKYTRISKKEKLYLYEFTGNLTREEITKSLPKNAKILEYYIDDYGIVVDNINNIPPENIQFLGRFSVWKHSYKLQDVISYASWNYDFRNIWNRQREFSNKVFDFDKLKNIEEKEKETQSLLLHLFGELTEVLENVNYKKHKYKKEVNVDDIKEELIDAFKYLLNLLLIWDIDVQEFVKLFNDKSKIVEERFENDNRKK